MDNRKRISIEMLRGNNTMKAYLIREVNGVYDYASVVFATTRNKARVIGMNAGPFEGTGLDYIDVEATRIPKLDKYYRGKEKMDWNNYKDRIAMVKEGNFTCSYEFEPDDCKTCPARKWCDRNNAY